MSAAQSKVINNKEFAAHYVHAGMIGLDGEKMSKSKGNLVFVSQLLREGVDAMVIRTALLRHHYRSDHMWHNAELEQSGIFLDELRLCLSRPDVAPTDQIGYLLPFSRSKYPSSVIGSAEMDRSHQSG
jgi:L-cysteine:1D-myo-inositol 2-amino-2-deoxy-alpha-D-glucopyranoside ligase